MCVRIYKLKIPYESGCRNKREHLEDLRETKWNLAEVKLLTTNIWLPPHVLSTAVGKKCREKVQMFLSFYFFSFIDTSDYIALT